MLQLCDSQFIEKISQPVAGVWRNWLVTLKANCTKVSKPESLAVVLGQDSAITFIKNKKIRISSRRKKIPIGYLQLWDENARFPDKYRNSDEKNL